MNEIDRRRRKDIKQETETIGISQGYSKTIMTINKSGNYETFHP